MKKVRSYNSRELLHSGGLIPLFFLVSASLLRAQGSGVPAITPVTTNSGGSIQEGNFGTLYSAIGEPAAMDSTAAGAVDGDATWTGFWQIMPTDTTSGVREEWNQGGAGESRIMSAAPNPFVREVTLYVRVDHPTTVRLGVYDMLGRHILDLIDDHREAGTSRVIWEPQELDGGTYLLRLEVDGISMPTTTIHYLP